MTVEFWTNAERFYEVWIIIILILMMNGGIAVVFVIGDASKENRKKFLSFILGLALMLGSTALFGHLQYRPYLEHAGYVTPLIRDRKPSFFGYTYYTQIEQRSYIESHALEPLRNLPLYEEERVTEPVIYLGMDHYSHYFERSDGEVFSQSRLIEFSETEKQAQIIGSRFTLKDDDFQEIGFYDPQNIMFESIKIPASEQGKDYVPEKNAEILRAENVIQGWTF